MIVPKFWAEGRVQHREPGRQITVRRFGWSNTSEAEAQALAQTRANEALQRILRGDKLERREPKAAYNGADGVPIREEIVGEYGDVVITRNSYGALCLNTPGVLFADVDMAEVSSFSSALIPIAIGGALAWLGWFQTGGARYLVLPVAAILMVFGFAAIVASLRNRAGGGSEQISVRRIQQFAAAHPDWRLRIYRTPAGFRVLALHRLFSPSDAEAAACFKALGTDPVYVRMCVKQRCFRARLTPKPWRIGMESRFKSQGVWPVRPERLPERRAWVQAYEAKAAGFAACRFHSELGNGGIHPDARQVQQIHDEICRANQALPLA